MGILTWTSPRPFPRESRQAAYDLAQQAFPAGFLKKSPKTFRVSPTRCKVLALRYTGPQPLDLTQLYGSPFWASTSNNIYNTRDLNLVVGNTVIESPSHMASRYYETTALYPIWYQYFEDGFRWIAAPKPLLNYEAKLPYFRGEDARVLTVRGYPSPAANRVADWKSFIGWLSVRFFSRLPTPSEWDATCSI